MAGYHQNRIFLLCAKPVFSSIYGIGVYFIVVLIALVIIFKNQLTSLVNEIFDKITSQSRLV